MEEIVGSMGWKARYCQEDAGIERNSRIDELEKEKVVLTLWDARSLRTVASDQDAKSEVIRMREGG